VYLSDDVPEEGASKNFALVKRACASALSPSPSRTEIVYSGLSISPNDAMRVSSPRDIGIDRGIAQRSDEIHHAARGNVSKIVKQCASILLALKAATISFGATSRFSSQL
jgi:hypothetical protein